MRRPVIAAFCALILASPSIAHARSTPQRLWTLPTGASFEGLTERPNHRLNVYWLPDFNNRNSHRIQYSTLDVSGRSLGTGEAPGRHNAGNGIAREDWNERGQHAFLPQCDGTSTNFLRLKSGSNYRALRFLTPFNGWTLQDLRFSPDGECLYVLGLSKLWIVGAQSGRLLRTIQPRWGKRWSDENASLSPDCRTILAMRGKMALFSTQSGRLLRRFGTKISTYGGHCGDFEAKVFFSGDGRFAIASLQGISDYETWTYPAQGGPLRWHGTTPYDLVQTPRGHFFLDTPRINDRGDVTTVLRRWRDGQTGWHLKLNFNAFTYEIAPHVIFSRDNRWIYFTRDGSLWRVPMPQFSAST